MKSLLLMRHAKSSWHDPPLEDYDRPLNPRGRRDAPRMGALLAELDLTPHWIVSSSAQRASETAAAVATACGFEGVVEFARRLYLAPAESYRALLRETDDEVERLLLIGHNPGISEFAASLDLAAPEMVTAAVAHFELQTDQWSSAASAAARLAGFWIPRELPD